MQCPSNYYVSATNSCIVCTSPCKTCTSDTNCVTCVDNYNLDGTTCVITCSGTKIPVNSICTSCDPACTLCLGSTSNCSTCAIGFLYTDDLHRCSLTCPAGYILYSANNSCLTLCPSTYYNLSGACTQCSTDCLSCVSANNCTSCNTGLILYNGLCYASCPSSVPYLINNECVSCDIANCKTCSNALCGSCQTGYLLIQYLQCIQNCPSGQTYNASIL